MILCRLEHWDVNNEMLHGNFYQDALGDQNYNKEVFQMAHDNDLNVKLFLNEYNVVAGGYSTAVRESRSS
jgi:endo-1,4-beta-xylanase